MATTGRKDRIGPEELGIDLARNSDREVFRWLVACELFGARISQDIAARAFAELDRAGVLTPRKLADADWQHLVDLLGRGGYRRYDESTARQLIATGKLAVDKYGGHLSTLPRDAGSRKDVEARLREFTGIGPTSAGIFLREMGPGWKV